MAHVTKFTKAACGHMFKHFERAKGEDGNYIKFGNSDIDTNKSHLNYNLAPHRRRQGDFVRKRCSDVYCLQRKDVNVMCSWVVTVPKDLPVEDYRTFFQASYYFLADRYGATNVVSAYVHMDEIQPHMHFAFVPVIFDQKKNREKVSAKETVNRIDLKTFHPDLEQYMYLVFNREIGILNEATKEGNRSIEELKRGTAIEKLQQVQEQVQNAQGNIKLLRDEKVSLERQIDGLKKIISDKEIDNIGEKSGLFGKKVTMSTEECQQLKDQAKRTYYVASKNQNLAAKVNDLQEMVRQGERQYNEADKEINKLRGMYLEVKGNFDFVKRVFQFSPELMKHYNQQLDLYKQEQRNNDPVERSLRRFTNKNKTRDHGMER